MTPSINKTHPMLLTAAVAVTIFSVLGSAAVTGLIPNAHSDRMESTQTASAEPAAEPHSGDTFKSSVTGKNEAKPEHSSASSTHAGTKAKSASANSDEKSSSVCGNCGVIESIRLVQHDGNSSGLGAVAGGVAGGVVGNQIGKGKGNILMTILGAGGGAYAGNTIEQKVKATTAYVVKVHMEDGTYRTVTQNSQPEYAVGDHVKIDSGHLTVA